MGYNNILGIMTDRPENTKKWQTVMKGGLDTLDKTMGYFRHFLSGHFFQFIQVYSQHPTNLMIILSQ